MKQCPTTSYETDSKSKNERTDECNTDRQLELPLIRQSAVD
jgi:hypothetical protein